MFDHTSRLLDEPRSVRPGPRKLHCAMFALCTAGGADLPTGVCPQPALVKHPHDVVDQYDGARVAECLERARTVLHDKAPVFEVMSAALEHPTASNECRPMTAESPFDAFEGWWEGRYKNTEVAHLWLTVDPGLQLVLIADDGVHQPAVNVMDDGILCGIVVEKNGRERVHEGRFFPATERSSAYLKWLTPDRNYYERVTCTKAGRAYEIIEEGTAKSPTERTRARYTPSPAKTPSGQLARLEP